MSKTLGAAMKKAAEKKVEEALTIELALVRQAPRTWRYESIMSPGDRYPAVVYYSPRDLGPRAVMTVRRK